MLYITVAMILVGAGGLLYMFNTASDDSNTYADV